MATSTFTRRQFSSRLISGMIAFSVSGKVLALPCFSEEGLAWYNVEDWGLEGKGWDQTKRYFDRLPEKAEATVRKQVWDLSRHAAGMQVRFVTDATHIQVRYKLYSDRLAMPHMPATGVSGLDLYAEDAQGIERWVAVTRPTKQDLDIKLAENLLPGKRRYSLYLPLYNGVDRLEIGVPEGSIFEGMAPRAEKPMLFYGTSIMHGACASRPGMAIPAILGRRFRRPTINLGFSGNGRMEKELAELLVEQDPAVFAIDCLPNMNAEMIEERAADFVRIIRASHQATPILLVEDRSFTNTPFFPNRKEWHQSSRMALRKAYRELLEEGFSHLFYLNGDNLLGLDGEAATDGSHPSDLGMMRYADAYEPALRAILKQY